MNPAIDIVDGKIDIGSTWFGSGEIRQMRSVAFRRCRASKAKSTLGTLLCKSYGSSQQVLDLWTMYAESQRGLEGWANETHGEIRKNLRATATSEVVKLQKSLKKKTRRKEKGYIEESLSRIAQRGSKDAKDFAIRMGLADEKAARRRDDVRRRRSAREVSMNRTRSLPTLSTQREVKFIYI